MKYRKSQSVVERRIRGEHLLVPIMGTTEALDSIYTLNETAGFVFMRAGEGCDAAAIAGELASAYAVEPAQARADVQRVLGELLAIGALEPVED
jgi:hypothetical protein